MHLSMKRRRTAWQWLSGGALFLALVSGPAQSTAAPALGPIDSAELAPTDLERVKVGEPAPDFTLETETGTPVTLSQFRGNKAVVLVFYRGHW